MKKLAGVVILFFPDENELFINIQSYLPFLDHLFIIDNTGAGNSHIREKVKQLPGSVQYIANKENEGVAAALNTAASLAYESGYSWLLTMDQDSYFAKQDVTGYFNHFTSVFYNKPSVAIVAPSIESRNTEKAGSVSYSELISVITSGSMIQLTIWNEMGKFDEKLFIDEVDHEYCYRCYLKGYKIVRYDNVYLNHSLGTKKNAGYLGTLFKSNRTIHSPARIYFIVRNYLYVRKKYKKQLPEVFKSRDAYLLTTLKNNLLFSGHFMNTLRSILRAVTDYRKGNFTAKI